MVNEHTVRPAIAKPATIPAYTLFLGITMTVEVETVICGTWLRVARATLRRATSASRVCAIAMDV